MKHYQREEFIQDGMNQPFSQTNFQDYPHPVQPTGDYDMNNYPKNDKRIDKKDWMIFGGALVAVALVANMFGGGRPRVNPHTVTAPAGAPTMIIDMD